MLLWIYMQSNAHLFLNTEGKVGGLASALVTARSVGHFKQIFSFNKKKNSAVLP